jgi:hypothetical protein
MRWLWLTGLVIFVLGFSESAEAQVNRKNLKKNNKRISSFRGKKNDFGPDKQYMTIGLAINALNYYGDISPKPRRVSSDITFTRPAFAIDFNYRIGPRIAIQSQYMWGTLKGSDSESADPNDLSNGIYRYKRNVSFRNQINELSVVSIVDLFKNEGNYISRVRWTPYGYVGVSGFLSNPQGQAPATDLHGVALPEAGQWINLRPLGTEGQYSNLDPTDANYGIKPYSKFQFAIPFGFGARIRINEVLDLSADIGYRLTFTDYLDDVSQNYVDLGVLNSELARAMSYRTGELNLGPANESSYEGRDGVTYTTENGYGREHPDNKRGGKNERDIFLVTSVRISYIIGATYHKAKFR